MLISVAARCPLAPSLAELVVDRFKLVSFKLVVVRCKGTLNVQAIVPRNIYAKAIEGSVAKRPPKSSANGPVEIVHKALGVAQGDGNLIGATIQRKGDARTAGL